MSYIKKFILPVIIILGMTAAAYADNITESVTGNLHYVAPGIYRSGQPTAENMRELEMLGLKSVLNLRNFHSDDDEAKGTGLTLYRVKMSAGDINNADVIAALKIVRDAQKPILIHCWHGSDRTGVIVAMYRIAFEEWDKEVAISELMQPEYGHHQDFYSNIPEYIRKVDIDLIKKGLEQ